MILNSQVIPFQCAVKLHKLGIRGNSLFWWSVANARGKAQPYLKYDPSERFLHGTCYKTPTHKVYNAFTVAEIGAMLNLSVDGVLPNSFNVPIVNKWFENNIPLSNNEAEMRGNFLVFCLENSILSKSEINIKLS